MPKTPDNQPELFNDLHMQKRPKWAVPTAHFGCNLALRGDRGEVAAALADRIAAEPRPGCDQVDAQGGPGRDVPRSQTCPKGSPSNSLRRRTQQDVEAELRELKPQSDQIKTRERKLRRERAAMIGGKASGRARAPRNADQARRRWAQLGGGRGSANKIAHELQCSRSTVYRWLALGG
jgi:hypothetical protein